MDLGVTLLRSGPCGDAGTSGYCYTATATLAGASRGRWTSEHCYTAAQLRWLGPRGDTGPRGTAMLGASMDLGVLLRWGDLEETLASRGRWCRWASYGRWCRWAPRRRWTSRDARDAGLKETLPAGAGAGLSKAILGARTPVAPRTSHFLWSGC